MFAERKRGLLYLICRIWKPLDFVFTESHWHRFRLSETERVRPNSLSRNSKLFLRRIFVSLGYRANTSSQYLRLLAKSKLRIWFSWHGLFSWIRDFYPQREKKSFAIQERIFIWFEIFSSRRRARVLDWSLSFLESTHIYGNHEPWKFRCGHTIKTSGVTRWLIYSRSDHSPGSLYRSARRLLSLMSLTFLDVSNCHREESGIKFDNF